MIHRSNGKEFVNAIGASCRIFIASKLLILRKQGQQRDYRPVEEIHHKVLWSRWLLRCQLENDQHCSSVLALYRMNPNLSRSEFISWQLYNYTVTTHNKSIVMGYHGTIRTWKRKTGSHSKMQIIWFRSLACKLLANFKPVVLSTGWPVSKEYANAHHNPQSCTYAGRNLKWARVKGIKPHFYHA